IFYHLSSHLKDGSEFFGLSRTVFCLGACPLTGKWQELLTLGAPHQALTCTPANALGATGLKGMETGVRRRIFFLAHATIRKASSSSAARSLRSSRGCGTAYRERPCRPSRRPSLRTRSLQ